MPFNGSGTFNPTPADNPVVTATVISSTKFNNTINDIASGLSNCVTRDGQSPMTQALPMGGQAINNIAAGSPAAPSVNFTGATTSGLYSPGANQVGISTAGVARMAFAAAGNITINAPSSGNHTINGDVTFGGVITGNGSGLTALNATNLGSGTVPDARFPATLPAASGVNLTSLNASNLASGTVPSARVAGAYTAITAIGNTSSAISIAAAGNVTVNAPSSGANLTVNALNTVRDAVVTTVSAAVESGSYLAQNTNAVGVTAFRADVGTLQTIFGALGTGFGTQGYAGTISNNQFTLVSNNTARIVLASAGNVTVNAPGSGTALTVTSGADLTGVAITGSVNNVSLNISNTGVGGASNWNLAASNNASGYGGGLLVLSRSLNVSMMRFTSNGNVSVDPPASGVALTVAAFAGQYGVNVTGGLGGQAVNWVATSDRRIKTDIADINESEAIIAVKNLRAKSYRKEGQRDLGLIAQDVRALGGKFADAVKQAKGEDLLALNYDGLTVAMLLPVVQSLLRSVDRLEEAAR